MALTAMNGSSISASEAKKRVEGERDQANAVGFITPYSKHILSGMQDKVQIVSVSLWPQTVPMGSWGSFYIPACPEGKDFVYFEMNDIHGVRGGVPGIMAQRYRGDGVMPIHEEDGREWAQKLCNNDFGIPPYLSLNRKGIAVIEGQVPTADELNVLRGELRRHCMENVQQARDWWNDPKRRSDVSDNPHHMSARYLKMTSEPWMLDHYLEAGDRLKCKMCGHYSDAGTIKCGNCREYVFDMEAYKKIKAEQKVA